MIIIQFASAGFSFLIEKALIKGIAGIRIMNFTSPAIISKVCGNVFIKKAIAIAKKSITTSSII